MASNVSSKKKTAVDKLAAEEAAIAAEIAAHAEKIAKRRAAVVKAQEEAAKEAERNAAVAARQASLASFGMPSIPTKKRMTPAQQIEKLLAANLGNVMVNNTAAAKVAAAAAFEALSASEKVRYLEVKAASDIAAAELRLADLKQRITEKLARDIAGVHKKSSSMNPAAVVLNAAASSSMRRSTQQVYNNAIANLEKERTRKQKKARGEAVSVSPVRRRKTSSERIANLEKKAAESMARLEKKRAAPAAASSSAAASSDIRRSTQQVHNNTQRELNKELTRKQKKERGNRNYTPSPPRRIIKSPERIARLHKVLAESSARLEKQSATAANKIALAQLKAQKVLAAAKPK